MNLRRLRRPPGLAFATAGITKTDGMGECSRHWTGIPSAAMSARFRSSKLFPPATSTLSNLEAIVALSPAGPHNRRALWR